MICNASIDGAGLLIRYHTLKMAAMIYFSGLIKVRLISTKVHKGKPHGNDQVDIFLHDNTLPLPNNSVKNRRS